MTGIDWEDFDDDTPDLPIAWYWRWLFGGYLSGSIGFFVWLYLMREPR